MAAQNVLAGDVALAQWNEVALLDPRTTLLLDVRCPDERARGFIPGSTHIPLDELRQRLTELPRDREIIAYCESGQRSYNAARILSQHGFRVRNLTGPYRTWRATQPPMSYQATTIPNQRSQQSKSMARPCAAPLASAAPTLILISSILSFGNHAELVGS
jgi:rhodanese-related sulfurtransferase